MLRTNQPIKYRIWLFFFFYITVSGALFLFYFQVYCSSVPTTLPRSLSCPRSPATPGVACSASPSPSPRAIGDAASTAGPPTLPSMLPQLLSGAELLAQRCPDSGVFLWSRMGAVSGILLLRARTFLVSHGLQNAKDFCTLLSRFG